MMGEDLAGKILSLSLSSPSPSSLYHHYHNDAIDFSDRLDDLICAWDKVGSQLCCRVLNNT